MGLNYQLQVQNDLTVNLNCLHLLIVAKETFVLVLLPLIVLFCTIILSERSQYLVDLVKLHELP